MTRVSLLRTHRPDDAELPHLVEPATLAVEFAGSPDALVAQLLLAKGMGALDAGDTAAALRHFDEGIVIASRGGVDPLTLANFHDNTARVQYLLGDPERAEASSLRALEVILDTWGPGHPAALLFHQNVAAMCMVNDDLPCARTHLAEATQILDDAGDATSMRRATNLGFWAQLELADGDLEAARRQAEAAVAMLAELGRENSPSAFNPAHTLREIASRQGRHEDAVRHARHVLTISSAEYGPKHPDVAWAHLVLGETLRDAGHPEAAREALESALRLYEESPDASPDDRERTKALLAELGRGD